MRKFIFILALLVFIGSAVYVGQYYYESWKTMNQTLELSEMFSMEGVDTEDIREDFPKGEYLPQFAKLWSLNTDVVGFLQIDDTPLQYAVMRDPTDKNNTSAYYLRRDFYENSNQHGIPFLDWQADLKKPSDNLIIFGHNMRDGQIFGELINYQDPEYYTQHPVIKFTSLYEEAEYKIISVFITNAYPEQGPVFNYHDFVEAENDESFMNFANQVRIRSLIVQDNPVDVKPGDKLLTLSTCTYEFTEARFVVVARKVRRGEDPTVDTTGAKKNPKPLMPDIWYEMYKMQKPTDFESGMVITRPAAETGGNSTSSLISAFEPPSSAAPSSSQAAISSTAPASRPPASSAAPPASSVAPAPSSSTPPASSAPPPESSSQPAPPPSSSTSAAEEPSSSSSQASSGGEDLIIPQDDDDDDWENDGDNQGDEEDYEPGGDDLIIPTSAGGRLSYAAKPPVFRASRPYPLQMEEGSLFDGLDIDPPKGKTKEDDGSGEKASAALPEELTVMHGGKEVTGASQEIVERVVQVEVGSGFREEAIKAQAVAAYTYILYHNEKGLVPNVFLAEEDKVHEKVSNAVASVLGEAVYYKKQLCFTPYHATSAGQTTSSKAVWGGSYPYLLSVDSSVDKKAPKYAVKKTFTRQQVEQRLADKLGIEPTGSPEAYFEILSETDGGYVGDMAICGETHTPKGTKITGRLLRESVLGLRSHCFTAEYNEENDTFVFITYGYGHGVGMSQNGANLYAAKGWSYVEILEHYYVGTTVA